MRTGQSSEAYPLIEPKGVELAAIERELEALWVSSAGDRKTTYRAAALNLIYAVHASVSDAEISDLISAVSLVHPARCLVVRIGDSEAAIAPRAWVTAFCHRPERGSPEICSEVVMLEVDRNRLVTLASLIAALKLPGLPSALIWDVSLPVSHELFPVLLPQVQRVITSNVPPCGTWFSLKTLLQVRAEVGDRAVITDLLWTGTQPWRERIASLFDSVPEQAGNLERITLYYGGSHVPAIMVLLAAWMMAALGWETDSLGEFEHGIGVRASDGKEIYFARDLGNLERIEFQIAGTGVIRCDEPDADVRFSTEVAEALRVWGRDPILERALDIVADWLEVLLSSGYSHD